jgi:hypothetical protein
MIKKMIFATLISLTTMNSYAFEMQLTSKSMIEMCQNSDPDSIGYNTCMSNINGYMAGLVHAKVFDEIEKNTIFEKEDDNLRLHDICLKPFVSNYQLAQVFIKYGEEHTEADQKDFFSVFYNSMKDSFPCSTKIKAGK